MKVPFFAAVLLAAVIYCSAADQECLDRKARNLPLQWGSATDCGTFYRCGPKDGVREMKCPAGKDFVERTGKCEKSGPRTCKLRGKQTPAAVENACDGVTPGQSVPDPTFCAQYYFCDGSASGILSSCPSGGYFDATRGNCVADTGSTCWQNKCINEPSGIFLPDSTSCRTYYFCAEGKTTRFTCLAGAYWTPAGNCQPDNDNLCYENYCLGQSNNVLVGNPNSCTGYYRCTDEVAVPLECPEGNYFNVGLGACVPGDCPAYTTTPASIDTTTQPPNTEVCCGQPDGAVVPDPDNCYAYYYCKDQLAENVQCEPGYYFDKVDKICALGVCPSDEICTCPGGYENGDIVKHPDNCMLFYICNNGDMVEKTCGYGNYWNPVAEECMLDTDGLCPQSAAPTTTAPTPTTPAAPTGAKLKKKVKPNAQRPKRSIDDIVDSLDEEDVLTLLEKPTEEHADDHEDETNALIERVLPEVAKPALKCLGIYNDGQFVAHPDDCRKFQICYDGDLYEQSCGLGNYFNGALDMCVPDTQNFCPIRPIPTVDTTTVSNCTCPGGYNEGQFVPYPGNCSLFYICHETLLLEGSCGEGNLFDNATSACVQDVNNTCWPPAEPCISADICTGVPDDSALPVPHQCNAFFFCMDNVSTYYQCPEGDYFNANVGICLPDIEATCINPCVNTTGIVTTLPHPDCSMYYLCNNGQTYVQNCTQGYYDVATGVCSTTAVCPTAFCQNQPEYTTFPVEGNTQEFYICIGGIAVLKQCLPGTAFNATVEVCLPAPSASCNQTMCPNNFEAFPTLDGQTNAFCFCKGNDAYLETCPLDYTFNETLGICYSNAPCDPMICLNSPDYTVSVNRNSSDSFCLCVYKQPVIVDCPAGTVFNQYQLLCLPPNAASSNCVPNSCVGVEQNTAISPMPGLTGFCFCQNNEATYYACPQNSVFNPTIGICQSPLPVDQACNASLCATETVFPTVNDPFSFCYCLDNGTVILQRCSDGTQFDPERQVCLQSPCNPDICIGQQNGATFPANNYTFGFCECNNQLPQLVPCLAGQMYSPEREICLAEVDLFCDVALCANATINNPYAVPAINNTSAFCYCTGPNNVMKLDCPSNSTFNATLSICVSEVQAGCTCPGGYADGSFVPHLTDCNAFFICNNGILHEMDCGEGNFFNATKGACQQDVANTCTIAAQTQSTCVGAFKNGDFLPHPLSSRLYYICMDAQLHESDCGPGNHFDAILGHCIGLHSRKVQKRSAPVDEVRSFKILTNFFKKFTGF